MVCEELAAYLEAAGLATRNVDLWLHVAPDEPAELALIIEYAGDEPDWVHDKRQVDTEHTRVQVSVRSERPEVARLRVERLYQSLMMIKNEMLSGTRYIWCMPVDTPAMIGRNESGLFIATVNFRVQKELTSV